jgi:AcrR family transcriptional regulator
MQGRKLNLKARAERQAQTRQRIVEAAVGLHTTLGPARTTISAIAERAGVQRQTVYAHFPDDRSLLEACSQHVRTIAPPPDPASLAQIADPGERVTRALEELYEYFERTAGSWSAILRDAEVVPLVREMASSRRLGYLQQVRDLLLEGFPPPVRKGAPELRSLLGLAVDFRTWETLARQGLSGGEAASLMSGLVIKASRG